MVATTSPAPPAPDWQQLVRLEPRLAALLAAATQARVRGRGRSFCANAVWFGPSGRTGLKRRMMALVGWERPDGHPVLSTSLAYETAYRRLYDALTTRRADHAA